MQDDRISVQDIQLFAEVILPIPLPRFFTYCIPASLHQSIYKGSRVIVEFGTRKILTGVVVNIHHHQPEQYQTKEILEVLDESPIITENQIAFWQWMADYYMCTIGEVFNAALPSGLKLTSSSKVQLNYGFHPSVTDKTLSDPEVHLLKILEQKEFLSYEEILRLPFIKKINPVIKSLVDKGRIILFEEIREKYKPLYIQKIKLQDKYVNQDSLQKLFAQLEKKPKQLNLIIQYLQKIPLNELSKSNFKGIDKKILLTDASESSLNTLLKNKIFEQFSEIAPRYFTDYSHSEEIILSTEQNKALEEINLAFQQKEVALLHGITGSGKTEVYMRLIQQAIESGSQVLYLLPEIALTTQIVTRLQKVFGKNMAIYHSRFSSNERIDVWHGIVSGEIPLVVGVRSGIFLPFKNLGLVIVDEEHESSYKQYDPAPRYNARDSAIMLAKIHYAKVLLGSATPSVESYYQAQSGKYALVNLLMRYGNVQLPEVVLVDMKVEKKNKTIRNNFSKILYDGIIKNKNNDKQTILFQNRRGYAPFLSCNECGYVFKCENCAVSLTYHMNRKEIKCHYCGYTEKPPTNCPECTSTKLQTLGFGTEKIEEDLVLFFPHYKIARMDLDTTRKKNSYQNIIENFESKITDILVGTQMVTKGFDFGNVSLVGIMDVDRFLHFPDFRSYEKTFQIVTQVSGRAGRRDGNGTVFIQTNDPNHPLFEYIKENNYNNFFNAELAERQKYGYPPFSRLIKIIVKDPVETTAKIAADRIAERLRKQLGSLRILGPEVAIITKIKNNYLFLIMVKIEKQKINLNKVKSIIAEEINLSITTKEYSKSYVNIDVDPF